MAVVPDDDHGLHNADEEARRSPRSQTPPTPPVQDQPSPPPQAWTFIADTARLQVHVIDRTR
jgi:hypothetical protein